MEKVLYSKTKTAKTSMTLTKTRQKEMEKKEEVVVIDSGSPVTKRMTHRSTRTPISAVTTNLPKKQLSLHGL